jgi:hypothetical protein
MSDHSIESALRFCEDQNWSKAKWLGTSFKLAPNDDAPPVLAILFDDYRLGLKVFRSWVDDWGNYDRDDDIRLAIIEGQISEQLPGYTIHISPQSYSSHGQWQRMHPLGIFPETLERFKSAYLKHGEFMLAPIVEHDDGLAYVNANAGIIKRELVFRDVSEIIAPDPDDIVLCNNTDERP